MRNLLSLKNLAIALGALVGLVVIGAIAFVVFFPKDWAIAEMERQIERATGRDLAIAGKVDLSFWPALGFSAEQTSLSNPDGFAEEPFLAANRIVFALDAMPLLSGQIRVNKLIFEGADLRLSAKPSGEANWTFPTEAANQNNQATIDDLKLDDVRMIDSRISFDGNDGQPPLTLEDVDASLKLDSLDQPALVGAAFTYRDERMSLDGTIAAPRALMEQTQTPLQIEVKSAPLEAQFDGAFDAKTGNLDGHLAAHGDSLRRVMAWTGSPLAEGGGFGAYRLTAQMAHAGTRTTLTEAALNLDAIDARGHLIIDAAPLQRIKISGALNAPKLDLNPYLPAPPQDAGGEAGVQVNTAWDTAPIDLSGLKAFDADLQLETADLRFQQMTFANVQMALRVANGAADARLTRISLYGGTGAARLIADGNGATPRIAVELATQNIQALPLLTDAIGFDKIEGRGQLTASLIGQGASQAAIMRTLRGTASFQFNDGAWRGVNLAQVARTVQAVVAGEAVGGGSSTDFAEMAAHFQVANGVAATQDLRLLNPLVRLDGTGLVDIGQQTLDMRIAPRAVRSLEGQGGDATLQGLGIPFRISGPWARVSFRPDLDDAVRGELERRARAVLSDQDADSPLGALGEALFGRQPTTTASAPDAQTTTPTADAPPAQQQEEDTRTPQQRLLDQLSGRNRSSSSSSN